MYFNFSGCSFAAGCNVVSTSSLPSVSDRSFSGASAPRPPAAPPGPRGQPPREQPRGSRGGGRGSGQDGASVSSRVFPDRAQSERRGNEARDAAALLPRGQLPVANLTTRVEHDAAQRAARRRRLETPTSRRGGRRGGRGRVRVAVSAAVSPAPPPPPAPLPSSGGQGRGSLAGDTRGPRQRAPPPAAPPLPAGTGEAAFAAATAIGRAAAVNGPSGAQTRRRATLH